MQELGYTVLNREQIPVSFNVIAVIVTEISLITPLMRLNVFVLSGVINDICTGTGFKGVTSFCCADNIRLSVLSTIPTLSLRLQRLFYGETIRAHFFSRRAA